jgi:hypothetical protein
MTGLNEQKDQNSAFLTTPGMRFSGTFALGGVAGQGRVSAALHPHPNKKFLQSKKIGMVQQ